jgi:amino acid permease
MLRAGGLGICIAGSLFLVIANFGYLAYGNDLKDSVLDNVSDGSGATSIIAKLALVVLVAMSFPLLFLEYKKNCNKLIVDMHKGRTKNDFFELSRC